MTPVRQMLYVPGIGAGEVDTLTFERLRTVNDGSTQRADFHVLAIPRHGRGCVSVDFDVVDVDPGSAVWIKPGAVHRWIDIADLDGDLVLFADEAPITPGTRALAACVEHSAVWPLSSETAPTVHAAIQLLRMQTDARADARTRETGSLLLSVLLNRLDQPHPDVRTAPDSGFTSFRSAVEAHFRVHHDVGFYSAMLGYSPRTLTRIVQRHAGVTAKSYVADRIVIEAKRLLAHDDLSVARCAAHLGFSDSSNFSQFFRTRVGQLPGQWQRDGAHVARAVRGRTVMRPQGVAPLTDATPHDHAGRR